MERKVLDLSNPCAVGIAVVILCCQTSYSQYSEPALLTYEEPAYPVLAVATKTEGIVDIEFGINSAGVPVGVTALGGHPLLRGHATRNVETWRFSFPKGDPDPDKRFRTHFEFSLRKTPKW